MQYIKRKATALFKSFRMRVALALVLSMLFSVGMTDLLISSYALRMQFEQIRRSLTTDAKLAASTIDVDTLARVPLNKDGIKSPAFKAVADKLINIKRTAPDIRYIYIMAKSDKPGIYRFVVDPEAIVNKPGQVPSYPGTEYDASNFPEMLKAFDGPTADRKLARDEWGVFLSGYAPILNTNGDALAILGVDLKASDVYLLRSGVHKRAAIVLVIGIMLAIVLAILIAGRVTGPIERLVEVTRHIAIGNFHHRVKIRGDDEIAELAKSFNKMTADLQKHIEELKRTTAEKERLRKELEIAAGIQQSFLPDHAPKVDRFEIAVTTLPASEVGGDFYDFIPVENDGLVLVVGDVSGKGIPAALFMAFSQTLIRATTTNDITAIKAVERVNKIIFEEAKTNMFVTLFYSLLDSKKMSLKYINAGHNPPLVVKDKTGEVILLKAQGIPLGIIEDIEIHANEIELKKGDLVVLYTDGITEAVNRQGEQFEIERLSEVIVGNHLSSADDIMHKIQEKLKDFTGDEPQFDDITLMVLKAV